MRGQWQLFAIGTQPEIAALEPKQSVYGSSRGFFALALGTAPDAPGRGGEHREPAMVTHATCRGGLRGGAAVRARPEEGTPHQ